MIEAVDLVELNREILGRNSTRDNQMQIKTNKAIVQGATTGPGKLSVENFPDISIPGAATSNPGNFLLKGCRLR